LKKELDDPDGVKLFKKQPSRCTRIARGAGVLIRDVNELIAQYSKLSELVRTMGGLPGISNNRGNTASTINDIGRMLDPRMLNQMGKFQRECKYIFFYLFEHTLGGRAGLSTVLRQLQHGVTSQSGANKMLNDDK
jgi:signal recognition particle subunit SRP54